MEKEWLVYEEAAELLGITVAAIEHLASRNHLPVVPWQSVPPDQFRYKTNGRIKRRYIARAVLIEFAKDRPGNPFYAPSGNEYPIEDVVYLAAAIDCEGCIRIGRKHDGKFRSLSPVYSPTVYVSNTDRRMLDSLQVTFGGTIRCRQRETATHREGYDWFIACRPAHEVIRLVRPYLRVKDAQADVFLRFYDELPSSAISRRAVSPEENQRRESLKEQIHYLNRRGPR